MVKSINKDQLVFFFCCVLMASIIYSKYLLSVSMFALAVLCLVDFRWSKEEFLLKIEIEGIKRMLSIYRFPAFFAVTLIFFIVLFGFWQTYDYQFWLERLRIKVVFLVFPLIFLALPRFNARQVNGLLYCLLLILFVTSWGVGINYLLDAEAINLRMREGHPMPMPGNHIRTSILMAMGILGGGYLYFKDYYWRYKWETKLIGFCTLFLFLFIHLLSVRSGLLSLYAAIFVLLLRYILRSKKYWAIAVLLAAFATMPFAAYYILPSFRSKMDYMRYDLLMYERQKGSAYADSGRIVSLKVGWDIWKRNPIFGVGAGNLDDEVNQIFESDYPDFVHPLTPHNQFLYIAAGSGVVGLLFFLFAFLFPFFYQRNYQNTLLLGFYTIAFTAFMLEHSIENSTGAAFFIFFLSLLLNHLNTPPGGFK